MKIVLVNPPCSANILIDVAPPLWALLLGSICEQCGFECTILDLNLEAASDKALQTDDLYAWATDRIVRSTPHVVCFSSMGVNSHVSLKIAELIKARLPTTCCMLGGPHFSAIAQQLLSRFPWIDVVATREADTSFKTFLRQLKKGIPNPAQGIPGLICRAQGTIGGSIEISVVRPFDVPIPAYHLVDLQRYFEVNPTQTFDFEAGQRGCTMACGFCYAPRHFGRGERRQDESSFVTQLQYAAQHGARRFFFVQDNFVNHPTNTIELCHRIAEANLGITFHCYATLPQLTNPVIEALAEAGCRSVYTGVDLVHPDSRRQYSKQLYRGSSDMLRRFKKCISAGIRPTASFLLEDPAADVHRLEATVSAASMAHKVGCRVRLNTLSLYPGTDAYDSFEGSFVYDDLKPRLMMDLPSVTWSNEYALRDPALFPFHSTHRSSQESSRFLLAAHALFTILQFYPDTLLRLAARRRAWEVIERVVSNIDPELHAAEPEYIRRQVHLRRFHTIASCLCRSAKEAFHREHSLLMAVKSCSHGRPHELRSKKKDCVVFPLTNAMDNRNRAPAIWFQVRQETVACSHEIDAAQVSEVHTFA